MIGASSVDGVQLAIDLVNTSPSIGVEGREGLPDSDSLVAFLAARDFDVAPVPVVPGDVAEMHRLRGFLKTVFDALDDDEAVASLNVALRLSGAPALLAVDGPTGCRLRVEPVQRAWPAVVAASAAAALGSMMLRSGRRHLGVCAGLDCGAVFIDESSPHPRRFCSRACLTRYSRRAHEAVSDAQVPDPETVEPVATTVLFCRSSGAAGAEHDAVPLALREAVNRSKGRVVDESNDSLAVAFPVSAADALACAIRMHDAVEQIGRTVRLRIGLSTAANGVAEAARLSELAEPAQTVLSADVHLLVVERRRSEFRWLESTGTSWETATHYVLRPCVTPTAPRRWEIAAAIDSGLPAPLGMCGVDG